MNPLIAAQVGKSLADIFSGAKSGQPVDMSTFKEAMDSIRNLYENYQDAKNLHLSNYIKNQWYLHEYLFNVLVQKNQFSMIYLEAFNSFI